MPIDDGSRTIAGRYRLSGELGRGGMGAVWRAWDTALEREVAVKEVLPPASLPEAERAETRQRVLREARAAARIDHPSVVTVHDVFDHGDGPWVVMELLRGRSLEELLRAEGPLPPARAAHVARGLLDGLHAAHLAGVVHRDIKPGNVMVLGGDRVVITDFGIATVEGGTAITRTGTLIGSPEYMPPERLESGGTTPAGDLWSAGATLQTALTGRSPFRRATVTATIAAVLTAPVPPTPQAGPLRPLLAALLRRDPSGRPGAAEALRLLDSAAPAPALRAGLPASRPGPAPAAGGKAAPGPEQGKTPSPTGPPTAGGKTPPAPSQGKGAPPPAAAGRGTGPVPPPVTGKVPSAPSASPPAPPRSGPAGPRSAATGAVPAPPAPRAAPGGVQRSGTGPVPAPPAAPNARNASAGPRGAAGAPPAAGPGAAGSAPGSRTAPHGPAGRRPRGLVVGLACGGGALLLLLVLGVVTVVSGGAAVDEDAYTVYQADMFRVEHPEEWRVYEDFGLLGDGNVRFESESRDHMIRIDAWYNTDDMTGADFLARQSDTAPLEEEGSTEVRTGEAREVPITEYPDHWGSGYQAAEVTRTLNNDTWPTPERRMTVYGVIIGDEGFTLTLNVPRGETRNYEPVFDRTVESFTHE
ncbi:protein kinase [Nocardiopsis sp. CNT-189]|uniref:serine/threonine-protein kinase n=1 Tax=Nocardiopsis oceanisediminis TaxID=2816862 RepID=UPI003B318759